MKIYWSAENTPELASLTPKQRKQVYNVCCRRYALKRWEFWASLVVLLTAVMAGTKVVGGAVGGAIAGGVGGGVTSVVLTNTLRPQFKEYVENEMKS
jgi:hypothetical protein